MKRYVPFVIVGLVCLSLVVLSRTMGPGHSANQELRLSYQVKEEVHKHGAKPETKVQMFLVGISEDSFYVDKGDVVELYRVGDRVLKVINKKSKTISIVPLDAVVRFSIDELQNRASLGDTVSSLGYENPFDRRLALEARFGLRTSDEKYVVTRKREGEETLLKISDLDLAGYSQSACLIPQSMKRSFKHFLVYECTLHPAVRDEILKDGTAPKFLSFNVDEAPYSVTKMEYRLQSQDMFNEQKYDNADEEFRLVPLDGLKQLGITPAFTPSLEARKATAIKGANSALENGETLEACLIATEYYTQSGDFDSDVQRIFDAAKKDPNARYLLQLIGREKDLHCQDVEIALEKLRKAVKSSCRERYVLDVFQASIAIYRERPDVTEQLAINVLKKHPDCTYAYYLLSTALTRQINTYRAAECNDVVMKLAPASEFAKKIEAESSNLRALAPDFF